jgi:hypothetical protein
LSEREASQIDAAERRALDAEDVESDVELSDEPEIGDRIAMGFAMLNGSGF